MPGILARTDCKAKHQTPNIAWARSEGQSRKHDKSSLHLDSDIEHHLNFRHNETLYEEETSYPSESSIYSRPYCASCSFGFKTMLMGHHANFAKKELCNQVHASGWGCVGGHISTSGLGRHISTSRDLTNVYRSAMVAYNSELSGSRRCQALQR